jgi:hypothetical protein
MECLVRLELVGYRLVGRRLVGRRLVGFELRLVGQVRVFVCVLVGTAAN